MAGIGVHDGPEYAQGLSDNVYLAVPPFSGRTTRRKDALTLCRRLGLGLLTVRLEPVPVVEALLDPAPYRPRQRKRDIGRLLRDLVAWIIPKDVLSLGFSTLGIV